MATVNKKGYIAPKGEGTCTVTCTLEYKGKTKELSVFVQVKRRVNVEGKYNFGEMWDNAKETGSVEIQELNVNYGDIIDGKKHTWNGKPIGKGMRGAFISRWENG